MQRIGITLAASLAFAAPAMAQVSGGGGGGPSCGPTATMVIQSAVGANSTATATIPAVAAKTNYLTGFEITSSGATAATYDLVTITGLLGGSVYYDYMIPSGVLTAATPLVVQFSPPLPASGTNVAIAVSLGAGGSGNTQTAVSAHGCVQ